MFFSMKHSEMKNLHIVFFLFVYLFFIFFFVFFKDHGSLQICGSAFLKILGILKFRDLKTGIFPSEKREGDKRLQKPC